MSHFLRAFEQIDGGEAVTTADEILKEVLEAVRRTGKKGSVSVILSVAPNGDRGFEVTTRVSGKAPELDFGKSFFFADKSGHLTRIPPKAESENILRHPSGVPTTA